MTMKLLSVTWANQMQLPSLIGILAVERDDGEKVIYIGSAVGEDEDEDIKVIMSNGGRVSVQQLEQILTSVKE